MKTVKIDYSQLDLALGRFTSIDQPERNVKGMSKMQGLSGIIIEIEPEVTRQVRDGDSVAKVTGRVVAVDWGMSFFVEPNADIVVTSPSSRIISLESQGEQEWSSDNQTISFSLSSYLDTNVTVEATNRSGYASDRLAAMSGQKMRVTIEAIPDDSPEGQAYDL